MSAAPSALVFDDVVIDFAGHRLSRDGQWQPLEPKAFAVLALLAGAPGQVFDRDAILDAVWGHRHVTPGVLNRIMTLLRHALGEDAHAPHYLHTVHGVGYRFDLPGPPAPRAPDAPTSGDEVGAGAASAQPADAPQRRAADHAVSAAAARRPWWPALAVATLLLGLGAWRWWPAPATRTGLATPPVLLVMPLKVIGTDAADAELAGGLSEELLGALARIDGLRVIARESTALATAESTDLRRLTQRLGVTHVVEGSVHRAGAQLRVTLRLVETASGQTRWAREYDRNFGDFLAMEREVAQSVSAALSLQFEPRPAPATPMDPERFRRYLQARALLRAGPSGAAQATTLFRALVTEDPSDARAHEGLASALYDRGFGSYQVVALRDEALSEGRRALALDPMLADPYAILSEPACRTARWDECLGLLAKAVRMSPADSHWRSVYAWRLGTLGYLSQAREQLVLALAADPLAPTPNYMMGITLDALGDHAGARPYIVRGAAPGNATLWFNAVWRHDYADAMRLARSYGDARWRPAYVAVTAALQDPRGWPAARAAIEASEQASAPWHNWTRVLLPDPDISGDIALLENVWKLGYSAVSTYLWAPELANHRRDPAFQAYLRRNHLIDYWRVHGWPDRCHAEQEDAVACD